MAEPVPSVPGYQVDYLNPEGGLLLALAKYCDEDVCGSAGDNVVDLLRDSEADLWTSLQLKQASPKTQPEGALCESLTHLQRRSVAYDRQPLSLHST
ncbi:MAG: hypothetical protein DSO08_04885 [Candidatus Methanomethylicota archaeon]|uniref:Uncharacterized protein n=1 Tax=Thermoproteota archaeon TaxID=2056631 RepID=A0A523BAP4_9CREN|nr:MAG: hypothetical protein DSO08_04885 [Candidatus Verstraetearchaeota archaeon]